MREIHDHDELRALCGDDLLCVWAARGLDGRSRAWTNGSAVAVAAPGLSLRDRMIVHGEPESLVPLVSAVLAKVGPTFRPLGDPAGIEAIATGLPGMISPRSFGWMDRTSPAPAANGARWLAERDLPDVTALLDADFPDSYAKPGADGVERWAGIRDETGTLLATAALAWSAPSVGLMAGVAVSRRARGTGLGRVICGFVIADALAAHGAVALMVNEDNATARRVYTDLGLQYRPVSATTINT